MNSQNYFMRNIRKLISNLINLFVIIGLLAPIDIAQAQPNDVPTPLYPADFSVTTSLTDPPIGVPSFTWSVVIGATKYRLQVDDEIGFNTPINLNITTPNTSFTPSSTNNLFSDGEWYWRVRVEEPAPVGDWSQILRFTKNWATVDNRPVLTAPDDGAMLAFFDSPVFSWTRIIGTAKYRFQISTEPGFSTTILSTDTLSNSIQPNTRFSNGTYYWRVITMDAADHLGTISSTRMFTLEYGNYSMNLVPILYEPTDESFPTFTPTFHWSAILGAEKYRLEYTSDEGCDFSAGGTVVETRQTFYTPTSTFPNDVRYCWRVRVESGNAVGDWSETWHLQKRWYLQPQLLTPNNLYINTLYPLYSWTPVPGAARYRIDIATNPSFNPIYESSTTANTTYAPQTKYDGTAHYYWRVTPIDGSGNLGLTSGVAEFWSYTTSKAPILVYPHYYYIPNDPVFYGDFAMNPVEDRTVPFPIFMWHRIMNPAPSGGVFGVAYRIQVDTNPYFNTIVWEYDTENTSATPTTTDNFTPLVGQDYYWRVCALDYIGGNCNSDPGAGWSQIWRARFDPGISLPPTNNISPELLRPENSQESVEATPLLEWYPYLTAEQYQVEISRDAAFVTYEISETVNIPAYSPDTSLAQRSLGRSDYGTFYWRVRGYVDGTWSDWSSPWRFQIASQSEWRYERVGGDPSNQLLIGSDPINDVEDRFDLTTLFAAQCDDCDNPAQGAYWFFGFNTAITPTEMTYVIYLDLDHIDNSGAALPPERPYNISTIAPHKPEFVIYVDGSSNGFSAFNTWVFAWNGSFWEFGDRLSEIGGNLYSIPGYVELQIPNSAIGMSQVTGSASIMLMSVNTSTNELMDSVPSDPNVPGSGLLSRFSAVSDHLNLIFPPNNETGDPTTFSSILPFYWDWPTGSNPSTPFAGMVLEAHLDAAYTNRVAEFHIISNTSYFSHNSATLLTDIIGDNIYYWRIQPRYWQLNRTAAFGAWTGGWSFRRLGLTAQNLQTSINWATPTFSWDMVEGANTYRLQVSTDPNFGSTVINQITPMTSYTPVSTLLQGNYYWRVLVNRYNNIVNDWSVTVPFTLTLPVPTGLAPDGVTVDYAPTFCWDPLITYDNGDPILTAWKYRLQVSRDPNFSTIYDNIDTTNNCWTPTKGYHDGAYYWHLAMIDGNGRVGNYTSTATFTKQYPITTLISPISGSVPGTPTFIWQAVDGAAAYVFEISKYQTFTPVYDSVVTYNTQYTPIKMYSLDTVYYWRVAIRDRSGIDGPFTDATIIIGDTIPIFIPIILR